MIITRSEILSRLEKEKIKAKVIQFQLPFEFVEYLACAHSRVWNYSSSTFPAEANQEKTLSQIKQIAFFSAAAAPMKRCCWWGWRMLKLSIRIYSCNKCGHLCLFPFKDPERRYKWMTGAISTFQMLKIFLVFIFKDWEWSTFYSAVVIL